MPPTEVKSSKIRPGITGHIDHSDALRIFPEPLQAWRPTILAYGSLSISNFIGFPIDAIKTRMQAYSTATGYMHCLRTTYNGEGLKGFFRGMMIPVLATAFTRSITVSTFIHLKPYTTSIFDSSNVKQPSSVGANAGICFITGWFSAGLISLAATPFDLAKVTSQVSQLSKKELSISPSSSFKSRLEGSTGIKILHEFIKSGGPKEIYAGFKYHFWRDSISGGVYYSTYESMKMLINYCINGDYNKSSAMSILISGGLSGVLAGGIAFPFDRAKSVVQREYVTNFMRQETGVPREPISNPNLGVLKRVSYNGLGASAFRFFLVNSLFFSFFEASMKYLV